MGPAPRRHNARSLLWTLAPLAAALALSAVTAAHPSGANAFSLTTCTLSLTSTDADGNALDTAFEGGADATESDPFFADWDGEVRWRGTSGPTAFRNNTWHIEIYMLPTTLRGGDAYADGTREGTGAISSGGASFFRLTGLYYISGEFAGDGGRCTGGGWVRLEGFPPVTIPFWIAVGVLAFGVVLLTAAYRRAWGLAIPGALLAGLGLAFVLIMFGIVPFGAWTPLGVLLALVLTGILVAVLAARRRPRPL
jgi:hypothetical protein